MRIAFVGQTHIFGYTAPQRRVLALAHALGTRGWQVRLYSAVPAAIRRLPGVTIRRLPSFSPESPGGWVYTIFSLLAALRGRVEVIHFTSWRAGALAWLAVLLAPETTLVWTISTYPQASALLARLTLWQAARLCDAITVPNRELQYRIRLSFGVLPLYIPDGYTEPASPNIPAKHWKLRKSSYTFALAAHGSDVRWIVTAYTKTGSRKKLVMAVPNITAAMKRLASKHTNVVLLENVSGRQLTSLIRQAAVLVFADPATPSEQLLHAMDAGRSVIAINEPLFSEVLGTTGAVVPARNTAQLTELFEKAVKRPGLVKSWGKAAATRARNHFHWQRLVDEYETLYHYPVVRKVPVDSIQPVRIRQVAV